MTLMTDTNKVSKSELLALHLLLCNEAREIMKRKNQDYTGGSSDPFANFRGSLAMGIEPEIGLMLRMTDKMQRAKAFVANGTLAVSTEGIEDIGHDLINYSILLTGLLLERQMALKEQAELENFTFGEDEPEAPASDPKPEVVTPPSVPDPKPPAKVVDNVVQGPGSNKNKGGNKRGNR
jgi:hypothetical protein